MKKFEAEATLVAMNLSEAERAAIINNEMLLTTDTHTPKVTKKQNVRDNKKNFKANRKLALEEVGEQRCKNLRVPDKKKKEKKKNAEAKGVKIIPNCLVVDTLPGSKFKVQIEKTTIICYLGGKLQVNNIKVGKGDHVDVEVSAQDDHITNGRITWRHS